MDVRWFASLVTVFLIGASGAPGPGIMAAVQHFVGAGLLTP
jgi:hypothetical protein